jgi:hypothetical protein
MKQPIFLGGCGSSGTTLLRKMLNAHPRIACGPEMSVFDRPKMFEISLDWLYTMWRNQDFEDLEEGCIFPLRVQPHNGTYCGLLNENHVRFYHKAEEVGEMFDQADTAMNFLDVFFSKYAQDRGKERWAEKTPNNIFCADMILEAYDDALFINVIRDGRDVVLSLFNRRNYSSSYVAMWRWMASINAGRRINTFKYQGNKRVMNVKYEDLVQRTEFTLMNICAFIGEKFDPAMMEYWKVKDEEDEEGDYGTQPVFDDSIGKWKKEDAQGELLDRMDLTMWDLLSNLGYETHG